MKFSAPKLEDCAQHGPHAELYIVEGDSAARTVLRIRNRKTQAVLPMQGKPMNPDRADPADLQKNLQYAALMRALGVDLAQARDPEWPQIVRKQIRYQRIVMLFDPDADGIHARTLLLLFFYLWMRPLLESGRLFDAHAPQWRITGKELAHPVYAATPEHMRALRDDLRDQGATELQTQRFRGLGNLDGAVLEEQCIDPRTRSLIALDPQAAQRALTLFEQVRELGRNS